MKKSLFLLLFCCSFFAHAQDSLQNTNHGSVKIKKKGTLHSVLYDDVNFRLVCRDIYGNINDTAVVSFDVALSVKGIAYAESTAGSFLSKPMQHRLSRLDGIVVLMFSNIRAKDKNGTLVSFPDFKSQIGTARENTDY